MLKKVLITLVMLLGVLATPRASYAVDCVQNYGQPTVCGVETVHVPVETGLAENLMAASVVSFSASGIFFYLSRKARASVTTY
jgi:hypothetical protein